MNKRFYLFKAFCSRHFCCVFAKKYVKIACGWTERDKLDFIKLKYLHNARENSTSVELLELR